MIMGEVDSLTNSSKRGYEYSSGYLAWRRLLFNVPSCPASHIGALVLLCSLGK